jgi:hypothetical protein
MSMLKLAYSTSTGDSHRNAWEEFDAMVARAAAKEPGASVEVLARILPAGIHYRLISLALGHVDDQPTAGADDGLSWVTRTAQAA